ncbi:uncharacterized protein K452DRAFT_363281 [Aplosporella prunicola CBS 121167]|uniref:Uncharacterized protein n=1 Tax=Aplosporella prunicola CBS 121167 TaxID=1176127 RepID=A0A6A6AWQ7_9PEZI|nr:uncharacterized protein K452DRAFT_363281 [Aplosporella prunicola CBS 121167]KAF2135227.1 hypothetical protein K452DRAFT_363281 [Aplosporella prunicola CBS 121167]
MCTSRSGRGAVDVAATAPALVTRPRRRRGRRRCQRGAQPSNPTRPPRSHAGSAPSRAAWPSGPAASPQERGSRVRKRLRSCSAPVSHEENVHDASIRPLRTPHTPVLYLAFDTPTETLHSHRARQQRPAVAAQYRPTLCPQACFARCAFRVATISPAYAATPSLVRPQRPRRPYHPACVPVLEHDDYFLRAAAVYAAYPNYSVALPPGFLPISTDDVFADRCIYYLVGSSAGAKACDIDVNSGAYKACDAVAHAPLSYIQLCPPQFVCFNLSLPASATACASLCAARTPWRALSPRAMTNTRVRD